MIRYLNIALAFAAGLVGLYCVIGVLGNVWAASFHDAYYGTYVTRIYICAVLSLISFGACVGVLFRLKSGGGISRGSRDHVSESDPQARKL